LVDKVKDILTQQEYEEAYQNAKTSGKILADLIYKSEIFGRMPINFICYSLGSVFVYSCLK